MPPIPLSPTGEATAQASPAVAMMQAAAEAKKRLLDKTALDQQYKADEEARMQKQSDLATAREQHLQTQDQNAALQRTMAGDMAITSQNPAYKGKNWDAVDSVDPYLKSNYFDRYGVDAMGNAGATWNKNVPQFDRVLRSQATKAGYSFAPDATDEEVRTGLTQHLQDQQAAKANQPPADIKSELVRMNKWRDGMTLEQAAQARDEGYIESGMIPEKYQGAATKLMGQVQHNPILSSFAKQKEAYDTMRSSIEHPESGGFGDMGLIEGFQRLVNPGATVRQATMANMQSAAGWLQQLDPHFQWTKAHDGSKLNDAARQRLMQLAEAEFAKSQRTAGRELASKRNLARMLGVPPSMTDNFVNSILTYAASDEGQTQAAQPQGVQAAGAQQPAQNAVRMTSPEGQEYMIPAANVGAAKQRGFK